MPTSRSWILLAAALTASACGGAPSATDGSEVVVLPSATEAATPTESAALAYPESAAPADTATSEEIDEVHAEPELGLDARIVQSTTAITVEQIAYRDHYILPDNVGGGVNDRWDGVVSHHVATCCPQAHALVQETVLNGSPVTFRASFDLPAGVGDTATGPYYVFLHDIGWPISSVDRYYWAAELVIRSDGSTVWPSDLNDEWATFVARMGGWDAATFEAVVAQAYAAHTAGAALPAAFGPSSLGGADEWYGMTADERGLEEAPPEVLATLAPADVAVSMPDGVVAEASAAYEAGEDWIGRAYDPQVGVAHAFALGAGDHEVSIRIPAGVLHIVLIDQQSQQTWQLGSVANPWNGERPPPGELRVEIPLEWASPAGAPWQTWGTTAPLRMGD